MNMLTDFGKVCRIIRLDSNENLGDMAEKLSMKSSFLSAIENGKKNIPKTLCMEIRELYNLSEEMYTKLTEAAEVSKTQIKIQMTELESDDRNLVFSFARKFGNLKKEEKDKIMQILKGDEK